MTVLILVVDTSAVASEVRAGVAQSGRVILGGGVDKSESDQLEAIPLAVARKTTSGLLTPVYIDGRGLQGESGKGGQSAEEKRLVHFVLDLLLTSPR